MFIERPSRKIFWQGAVAPFPSAGTGEVFAVEDEKGGNGNTASLPTITIVCANQY